MPVVVEPVDEPDDHDRIVAERDAIETSLNKSALGVPYASPANVLQIIIEDPEWRGVLAYDELRGEVVTTRRPPWDSDVERGAEHDAGPWTDEDGTRLAIWISREYDLRPSARVIGEAVTLAAKKKLVHPIRDYLTSLEWDGTTRLDTWLTFFMGADDNEYTRAVASKFLIAAVARAMKPGCKVDTLPILEGPQGIGKSTALRLLASDAWFAETSHELASKDSFLALRGKWIVELSELDALSRSEVSRTKAFLSATTDTYRPPYARAARDFPRACVFAGTTNANEYLRDDTGNRRFWPARVQRVDVEALRAVRDQLWAEARVRFERGEAWHITGSELLAQFEAQQDERRVCDPWEQSIRRWLETESPKEVTTHTILRDALDVAEAKRTRADETRVGAVLHVLGWRPQRVRRAGAVGGRVRIYRPPTWREDGTDGTRSGRVINLKRRLKPSVSQPSLPLPQGKEERREDQGNGPREIGSRSVGPVGTLGRSVDDNGHH